MLAVLEEALLAACVSVAGITPAQFRVLVSPEDVEHNAGGDIPVETLRAYAASMRKGGRSDRLALLGDRQGSGHPPPALRRRLGLIGTSGGIAGIAAISP